MKRITYPPAPDGHDENDNLVTRPQDVTVLQADVVNSTAVFEHIDPEYVHQIIKGFFAIIIDEIHKYMGSINQFRGDCALAVFTADDETDHHSVRACHAALNIKRAVREYAETVKQEFAIPFAVRIGVSTGPVVMGAIVNSLQKDFMAGSETTFVADRLESMAKPGKILISANTHKRADALFELRPSGSLQVSENEPSIQVYELLAKRAAATSYYSKSRYQPQAYTPKHLAEKILTTRSAIEGERKQVTVMFADIVDAAKVFAHIDLRDIHRIVNGWFTLLLEQIHAFEGIVNQFRGDRVMAIFGAPIAHEDHAARACHAALGIMRAVKRYRHKIEKEYQIDFAVQIGLNTGRVVVGSIGNDLRMDYTADGDTSNLTARMQANARSGTTLVSSNTYKRVSQLFEFKASGSISVKGKQHLIDVYELVHEKVYRPRLGLERQIYSDMVGRHRQLAQLESQVKRVIKGSGAVVNIVGEAGIGKSRLVAELMHRESIKDLNLLEGKAISIGATLSFYPIIDLLKNWAEIGPDDGHAATLEKLVRAVAELNTGQQDEIIPFIATLMGLTLSGDYAKRVEGIAGEALENLIFKNLRELIIQIARTKPVIIVMEDLHWADLSSIGFIESLFRLAQTHPVMFINPIRPGYENTSNRLIAAAQEELPTHYMEIKLAPLNIADSETMITNMLSSTGLPVSLVHKIVQRADGNPYFIEEVARAFIDEGVLVAKDGHFMTTEKIHHVVIPTTINDLLTARIDRLEENNRELIKTASVIGRNFFYRILKNIAQSDEDIDQRLAFLKDIQMILERKRLSEIEYLFTHALAQEAAYESILLEKRKPLHLKVAQSIETLFANNIKEFYGILSFHYKKGEDFYRTEEYLIKSGEEALKSSASTEAVTFFTQALTLYRRRSGEKADPAQIAYLQKCIALGYYNSGQLVESIPYLKNALGNHGIKQSNHIISGTVEALVCFFIFIMRLYLPWIQKKKTATAQENEMLDLWYKQSTALAICDKTAFIIETIKFCANILGYELKSVENGTGYLISASILFSYGGISFSLARKIIDTATIDLEQNDVRSSIQSNVANHLLGFLSGNFKAEAVCDEKLVSENLKLGEIVFTTFYINQFIFQSIEKGLFEYTLELIEKEFEIIETHGCEFSLTLLFYLKARVHLKMRKLGDALNAAQQGIVQAQKSKADAVLCQLYAIKAHTHILDGDFEKADRCLAAAENINLEMMLPFYLVEVYMSRFIVELVKLERAGVSKLTNRQKAKTALRFGKKTIRIAKKTVYNSVELYRYIGRYYWVIGKREKAFGFWQKSMQKGECMGTRPELARSYMEVGRHLLDRGCRKTSFNGLNAQTYLNKAKILFEAMDLQWDLDRLNAIIHNRGERDLRYFTTGS